MTVNLPSLSLPKLKVTSKAASQAAINKLDHLIVVMPDTIKRQVWSDFPYKNTVKQMYEKSDKKNSKIALSSHLPNRQLTGLTLGVIQKGRSSFQTLSQMRILCQDAVKNKAENIGILVAGFSGDTHKSLTEDLLSAVYAAGFKLWDAKKGTPGSKKFRSIEIFNAHEAIEIDRIKAEAGGNNLARWLTALPPNVLNSKNYVALLEILAKRKHWEFEFLDCLALKKLGAGAFLAVAQGNPHEDAGIVHLKYRPKQTSSAKQPDLALVGKGICFDTGGTNLKPHPYMLDMHGDMGGSAVALGSFYALTQLKPDLAIDCWLAITENHIDAKAYMPRDVVKAVNGTTIEVIHTDAEGRMALADTLALCSKTKPKLIMDYATLTGAAVYSMTERYSCVFTNRPNLHGELIEHGVNTGERVWPFPQDEDYDSNLSSKVADTLQCSIKSGGDHILAARFLNKFVDNKSAWIHMDLSASEHKGGLAHIPTKQTGFGVRYTTQLILQNNFIDKL
jgi:leucyl aminopeptidase